MNQGHEKIPTALVGAGRLGRSLAPLLGAAGFPVVAVASRRGSAAHSVASLVPGAMATTSAERAARGARLVLLAVPDRAIAEVAAGLAAASGIDWTSCTVLHHAGALGLEPLRPLARAGAAVGVLHPLQCLGDSGTASALLPGSRARIEGEPAARRMAARIARGIGLIPLRLPASLSNTDRAAYHAAASLASNDLLALLSLGVDLLVSLGVGRRSALDALLTLARGTLVQLDEEGLRGAISGPVVRGDTETVAGQLRAIRRVSREGSEAHRLLSLALARATSRIGTPLPAGTVRRLRALSGRPAPGRPRRRGV